MEMERLKILDKSKKISKNKNDKVINQDISKNNEKS